jgi:hypothetical protein
MEEVDGKGGDIIGEIDPGRRPGLIEFLVNEGDRPDAVLAGPEQAEDASILDGFGLKAEQTGDDLEMILDLVEDLFEEIIF